MSRKTIKENHRSAFSELGRLGGRAVVKKYGKNYMRKIGIQGAKVRWYSKDKSKVLKVNKK